MRGLDFLSNGCQINTPMQLHSSHRGINLKGKQTKTLLFDLHFYCIQHWGIKIKVKEIPSMIQTPFAEMLITFSLFNIKISLFQNEEVL